MDGSLVTGNLSLWDSYADIDPKFTKPITGKAYKGTSPNPQYIIRCLTEMFGPVGIGFGWVVVAEQFQSLGDEVLHWCRIEFWHTDRTNIFQAYGQTKALMKTKNGLMVDEDAPKKSLTDAIVKAASQIGIAANIFLGSWDDQKYVSAVADEFSSKERAESRKASEGDRAAKLVAGMQSCDSLEKLSAGWGKLSAKDKALPGVAAAKDEAKKRLDRSASAVPDDKIPY